MSKQLSGEQMRSLGQAIKEVLPKELAFALLVFPIGEPGIANYISNANREDMIKAIEETVERLKKGQTFDTPNSN